MSDATDESHIIVVIISVVSSLRNGASGEQWCYGDGRVTRDDIEPSFWRRTSRRERIYWTTAATRDDNMASITTVRDSRRLTRAAAERPRRNNGNVRLDVLQQWIREDCVRDTYGFVCSLWPIESSILLILL